MKLALTLLFAIYNSCWCSQCSFGVSSPMLWKASHHFGTWDFGKSHFGTDVSSGNILACAPFVTADIPADRLFNTGTFRHRDFLARGIFGVSNFRPKNISAQGLFGTWTSWHSSTGTEISVPKCPYWFASRQNIHVLKCPCTEMFLSRRFLISKIPCAWKLLMLKHSHVETSICQNVLRAKQCMYQNFTEINIHAKMNLAKISGAKMLGSLMKLTEA